VPESSPSLPRPPPIGDEKRAGRREDGDRITTVVSGATVYRRVRQSELRCALFQTRLHTICCYLQDSLDIDKTSFRQVVEISKPMFKVSASCGVLHSEPHFLQCNSSVIVLSQDVDAGFLQRAKKAAFTSRLVSTRHRNQRHANCRDDKNPFHD